MNDFIHHRIEKVAVVGNQDQRALIAFQPALQPDHRIKVEVVGWFIQQQQVGAANQRLRQVKTHPPAAGEVADRAFQLFVRKAKAVQQAGRAGANGPGVNRIQFAMDGGNRVSIIGVIRRL